LEIRFFTKRLVIIDDLVRGENNRGEKIKDTMVGKRFDNQFNTYTVDITCGNSYFWFMDNLAHSLFSVAQR
jgi:hypothetical protein